MSNGKAHTIASSAPISQNVLLLLLGLMKLINSHSKNANIEAAHTRCDDRSVDKMRKRESKRTRKIPTRNE